MISLEEKTSLFSLQSPMFTKWIASGIERGTSWPGSYLKKKPVYIFLGNGHFLKYMFVDVSHYFYLALFP